jgi:hypothetical protein
MTRHFWRAIDFKPKCWIGSLGLTDAAVPLSGSHGLDVANGDTYLPRSPATSALQGYSTAFTAPAGSAILISNVLGGYEHFDVTSAKVNGEEIPARAQNDLSLLYRSPTKPGATVDWTFVIKSTHIEGVDIVAIPQASEVAKACFLPKVPS